MDFSKLKTQNSKRTRTGSICGYYELMSSLPILPLCYRLSNLSYQQSTSSDVATFEGGLTLSNIGIPNPSALLQTWESLLNLIFYSIMITLSSRTGDQFSKESGDKKLNTNDDAQHTQEERRSICNSRYTKKHF